MSSPHLTVEQPTLPLVLLLAAAAALFGMSLAVDAPVLYAAALAGGAMLVAVMVRPIAGFMLALVLLPLELVGRIVWSQPALTWGKVAVLITFLGVLAQMLVGRRRFELPPLSWTLFGLVAAGFVGSAAGGFGITFDTFKMTIAIGSQVLVVLLAYHLLRTEGQIAAGVLAVVGSSVPVVVFGLIEIVTKRSVLVNPMLSEPLWAPGATDVFRITSTFYDPNALARYLAFSLIWAICALWLKPLARFRPLLLLMIGLQAFCLLNTFSRAGFLAAGVVIVPLVVAALVRRWHGAGLAIAGVGAAVAAVLAWPLMQLLLARFDDPTAGGRVGIVSASIPVIGRSPLFGYGREHIAHALGAVLYEPTDPHNLYTEILLSVGVLGAMIALAWAVPVGRSLIHEWRGGDPYARLLILPLLSVLIFGMSLQGLDGYELWAPFAFAMPVLRLATCKRGEALCG